MQIVPKVRLLVALYLRRSKMRKPTYGSRCQSWQTGRARTTNLTKKQEVRYKKHGTTNWFASSFRLSASARPQKAPKVPELRYRSSPDKGCSVQA